MRPHAEMAPFTAPTAFSHSGTFLNSSSSAIPPATPAIKTEFFERFQTFGPATPDTTPLPSESSFNIHDSDDEFDLDSSHEPWSQRTANIYTNYIEANGFIMKEDGAGGLMLPAVTTRKRSLFHDETEGKPTAWKRPNRMNRELHLASAEATKIVKITEEDEETDLGEYDIIAEEESDWSDSNSPLLKSAWDSPRKRGNLAKPTITPVKQTRLARIAAWRAVLAEFIRSECPEVYIKDSNVNSTGCVEKNIWFTGKSVNARILISMPITHWKMETLPVDRLKRMVTRGDFSIARRRIPRGARRTSDLAASDDEMEGPIDSDATMPIEEADGGAEDAAMTGTDTSTAESLTEILKNTLAEYITCKYPDLGVLDSTSIMSTGTLDGNIRFIGNTPEANVVISNCPSRWSDLGFAVERLLEMLETRDLDIERDHGPDPLVQGTMLPPERGLSNRAEDPSHPADSGEAESVDIPTASTSNARPSVSRPAESDQIGSAKNSPTWPLTAKDKDREAQRRFRQTLATFIKSKFPDTEIDYELVSAKGCLPLCFLFRGTTPRASEFMSITMSRWPRITTVAEVQSMIKRGEFIVYKEDPLPKKLRASVSGIIRYAKKRRLEAGETSETRAANPPRVQGSVNNIPMLVAKIASLMDAPASNTRSHTVDPLRATPAPLVPAPRHPSAATDPRSQSPVDDSELHDCIIVHSRRNIRRPPLQSTQDPLRNRQIQVPIKREFPEVEQKHESPDVEIIDVRSRGVHMVDNNKSGEAWTADMYKVLEHRKAALEARKAQNMKRQEEMVKAQQQIETDEKQLKVFLETLGKI